MHRLLLLILIICPHALQATLPPDTTITHISILKPAVVAGGVVAFSFLLDGTVQRQAQSVNFWDDFGNVTDYAGEKTIIIPSLLLTYGLGRFVIKDKQLQKVTMASMKAVLVSAVLTESLKHAFGRARPFTNEGPNSYQPFPGSKDQYKSLPSGHSNFAFAVFTPFAEGYSRWIYLVPASVAAGRVLQNKHWVSDVALGSGIGFIAGYLFYHHKKRIEPIPNGLVIYF
jgi:membrane-associated phospholipid phosphatase